MRRNLLAAVFLTFVSSYASARTTMPTMRSVPTNHETFTYDVSASSGTENGNNYSEIKVNLNWFLTDWLNWKNGIFTRLGSNVQQVSGLDSSLLASYDVKNESGNLGFQAFVGPGVRVASADNNAATAEAGVIFTLGPIKVGGGAKYLSYFKTREDENHVVLPKNETQYFIVLSGGGSL